MERNAHKSGLWAGILCFVLWGLFPLYWHLLAQVPAFQITAQRMLWGGIFVLAWLAFRQKGWLKKIIANPKQSAMLTLSGLLIGANWTIYIWAVNSGHVIETSLGYFINPILSVLLGVLVLREKLSSAQWLAVSLAFIGVLWLTFNYGNFPWIALTLASSFAIYGLVRKLIKVDAIPGLGFESLILFIPSLIIISYGIAQGHSRFFSGWGVGVDLLLIFGGVLTAVPLIAFNYAVQRIPYTVVGILQYIAPTLQLLCGIFFFNEPFTQERLIGFAFIWLALAVFMLDGIYLKSRRTVA